MTSSLKANFDSTNSWASRAGVVVGYKPEDTMKSFLFNQNNRHCVNINQNEFSILQLPQSELENALNLLSSDSDSESSSMTKVTVKNASSVAVNSYEETENVNINKKSRSGTEIEMWNKNENSDDDCTSADISNDFEYKEDKISIGIPNKTFEEILEEKLKHDTTVSKIQKDHCKSDPGTKPKFSFLKKNSGKSAWCSNIKTSENLHEKINNSKSRSQSNEREKTTKQKEMNKSHQPARKMKSLSSMIKRPEKPEIPNKPEKQIKSCQKTVHFASSYQSNSRIDLPIEDPVTITQINQKAPEIEDTNSKFIEESQMIDKDLVEFELLEQIANVSISSSIASSLARYDEENLRVKLRHCQNMPPPLSITQNKSWNSSCNSYNEASKTITRTENPFQVLSVCEEKSENIQSTNSSITNVESDFEDIKDISQNTSVNTTTLSEYEELKSCKPTQIPIPKPPTQALTRKVSKQKERYKNSEDETEEWLDDNPFQLKNNNISDKINDFPQRTLLKSSNIDWTFADPFHESDSYSDEDIEPRINQKQTLNDNLEICPIYPKVSVDQRQSNPEDNLTIQSVKLKQWVQLLESEVNRFKLENCEIEKMKIEKEEGLKRLEEEMKQFQKYKDDEVRKFEEYKQTEIKKLKKERKVFEEYQEAMKSMPNKKDRREIDNLKAEVELLKEEASGKEARWQAANSRLKQKVDQFESENSELHTRIHGLEQKRLQLQAQLVSNNNQKPKQELNSIKPKPTVTSVSQAISMKHMNIPINMLTKEDNNNNKCVAGNNKTRASSIKPTNVKANNNNSNKQPKQLKNNVNPFSADNGNNDIRGSAASDYYTGEEESGSVDSKSNGHNSNSNTYRNEIDVNVPVKQNAPSFAKMNHCNDIIKDEIHHPDGIVERIYMNGGIDVVYPNGSLKQISPDSKSILVHLYNGDVKQITPDGRVIYFYAQDESTQTTYSNGKEEIVYKNGHKEVLHPSGVREINFPDKSVKILHPDLTEETFFPNGLVMRISNTGDKEILLPNGQKEIHTNGVKKRIYPDGTSKTVYPDGRQETFYASGRMRVKDKNGNLILDQYVSKNSALTNSD